MLETYRSALLLAGEMAGEETARRDPLATLGGAIIELIVIGIIAVVVIYLLRRHFFEGAAGDDSGAPPLDERRFESETMGSMLAARPGSGDPGAVPASTSTPATAPPPSPVRAPGPNPGPPAEEDPGEQQLQDFRRRLEQLRVIGHLEGRVPLAVPPNGMVCRMTRGGSCLLLPRLESPETMDYFLRRFGTVIYPGKEGDPVLMERVNDRLGDLAKGL